MSANLPLLLIVDDNPENLTVIGELLQPRYRVRAANGGPRALWLATVAPQPDLILLDVMMPDMDGYEVLARLRADPATRDIPVVFLTALDSAADEERGLQLGAVDYIAKPIRPAVLLARVRQQLAHKLARDQRDERIRQLEAELRAGAQAVQAAGGEGLAQHVRALAQRDPFTDEHLRRCRAYMRVLAQHLRDQGALPGPADEHAVDQLAQAAAFHDIGMAVIPQHVLQRGGDLPAAEQALLRRHTTLGAELIAQAEQAAQRQLALLRTAHEMALHHHERWDGAGHPDGLRATDIPFAARLMAVVGSFDSLIWPINPAAGTTIAGAREQLRQGRGTRFDPTVMDAFEACFDQLAAIASAQRPSVP